VSTVTIISSFSQKNNRISAARFPVAAVFFHCFQRAVALAPFIEYRKSSTSNQRSVAPGEKAPARQKNPLQKISEKIFKKFSK
jgi:hypothetical protein